MTAYSTMLRGVLGLVDVSKENWRQNTELFRPSFRTLAIPGVAEQMWRPDIRELPLEQLLPASRRESILVGTAGIWPRDSESISDTLEYINQTVERTRQAGAAGTAFALVPTPIGLRSLPGQTAQAMVYRYFRDVQAKAAVPLVIYQPTGTPASCRLEPDSILSLVRLGRIAGLVMEEGDRQEVDDAVRASRRADFTVLCGEQLFPQALEWGARGVAIPIDSNKAESVANALNDLN